MKLHRIFGVILRFLYQFRHSYDRLSDAFYWPTMDLLLWGLTSAYFTTYVPNQSHFITIIVSGILLWLIVWRAQYEITVGVLSDLWDKNFINMFISPLTFSEWLISFVIIGLIKGLVSILFAMGVAFLLYKVQIFFYGFYFIPFLILLFMTGWWVGFFVAGIIIRYGTKIQTLAWSVVALLMPFSAIYYPLSILPKWAQQVSLFIPTSYVFEGSRQIIQHKTLDMNMLLISFVINLIYLILSIWFLKRSFNCMLNKGLANLS